MSGASDREQIRARLIEAGLASVRFRAADGVMSVGMRDNEGAADAALEVIAPLLSEVDRLEHVIRRARALGRQLQRSERSSVVLETVLATLSESDEPDPKEAQQ